MIRLTTASGRPIYIFDSIISSIQATEDGAWVTFAGGGPPVLTKESAEDILTLISEAWTQYLKDDPHPTIGYNEKLKFHYLKPKTEDEPPAPESQPPRSLLDHQNDETD